MSIRIRGLHPVLVKSPFVLVFFCWLNHDFCCWLNANSSSFLLVNSSWVIFFGRKSGFLNLGWLKKMGLSSHFFVEIHMFDGQLTLLRLLNQNFY